MTPARIDFAATILPETGILLHGLPASGFPIIGYAYEVHRRRGVSALVFSRQLQVSDHLLGLQFAITVARGNLRLRRARHCAALFARLRPLRTRLFRVWRTASHRERGSGR